MDYYSSQINKLIQELSELPGIGAKSAQRLAFHILNMPVEVFVLSEFVVVLLCASEAELFVVLFCASEAELFVVLFCASEAELFVVLFFVSEAELFCVVVVPIVAALVSVPVVLLSFCVAA